MTFHALLNRDFSRSNRDWQKNLLLCHPIGHALSNTAENDCLFLGEIWQPYVEILHSPISKIYGTVPLHYVHVFSETKSVLKFFFNLLDELARSTLLMLADRPSSCHICGWWLLPMRGQFWSFKPFTGHSSLSGRVATIVSQLSYMSYLGSDFTSDSDNSNSAIFVLISRDDRSHHSPFPDRNGYGFPHCKA